MGRRVSGPGDAGIQGSQEHGGAELGDVGRVSEHGAADLAAILKLGLGIEFGVDRGRYVDGRRVRSITGRNVNQRVIERG